MLLFLALTCSLCVEQALVDSLAQKARAFPKSGHYQIQVRSFELTGIQADSSAARALAQDGLELAMDDPVSAIQLLLLSMEEASGAAEFESRSYSEALECGSGKALVRGGPEGGLTWRLHTPRLKFDYAEQRGTLLASLPTPQRIWTPSRVFPVEQLWMRAEHHQKTSVTVKQVASGYIVGADVDGGRAHFGCDAGGAPHSVLLVDDYGTTYFYGIRFAPPSEGGLLPQVATVLRYSPAPEAEGGSIRLEVIEFEDACMGCAHDPRMPIPESAHLWYSDGGEYIHYSSAIETWPDGVRECVTAAPTGEPATAHGWTPGIVAGVGMVLLASLIRNRPHATPTETA